MSRMYYIREAEHPYIWSDNPLWTRGQPSHGCQEIVSSATPTATSSPPGAAPPPPRRPRFHAPGSHQAARQIKPLARGVAHPVRTGLRLRHDGRPRSGLTLCIVCADVPVARPRPASRVAVLASQPTRCNAATIGSSAARPRNRSANSDGASPVPRPHAVSATSSRDSVPASSCAPAPTRSDAGNAPSAPCATALIRSATASRPNPRPSDPDPGPAGLVPCPNYP